MTTFTEIVTEKFHIVSCYSCSLRFGVTAELFRRAVSDHIGVLYCPACGKETCWVGKTEAQKLQEKLQRERQWHDQTRAELEATERRRAAAHGQVTKITNRISKGVCPCCNRYFPNLMRHMANKHPDYAKESV